MRRALVAAIALVAVAVPAAAVARPAATKPVLISITAVNGRPVGGIKRPSVKKGQTVRIVIRTNVGTEIHLHGYNLEKKPKKGVPTVMQFVARLPGRFELELHHPDALLAQLTVQALIHALLPRVLAHGIGGIQDLPIPLWLVLWGGAFVVVVSFIALGALWKTPQLTRRAGGRDLGAAVAAFVLGPVRIVVQAISVVLFVAVLAAALFGTTDSFENLAPIFVYVIFWLAVPALSVLFGNVWRALSPWRALADLFVWIWEALGREARPLASYPERAGRYPGVVALFAFVALELAYSNPSSPRALAFAIALYSYVALFGMLAFGRESWTARGEGFAILFAYIARIAPLCAREGRIRLRVPLSGLAGSEHMPGSVLFVAVALGSVAFDGFSRTTTWQDLVARVEGPYVLNDPGTGELLVTGLNLLGLVTATALVLGSFLAACAIARSMVAAPRPLAPEFVLSLVPIAFVYAVAHYFSYFVNYGQYLVPLLSDPLGRGWDLFGTADVVPNLAVLTPNTIRWVQFGALVLGHVAGLAVAHDRAVTIFSDRQDALRSQFPMLALMVLYTVGGLWLLSRS